MPPSESNSRAIYPPVYIYIYQKFKRMGKKKKRVIESNMVWNLSAESTAITPALSQTRYPVACLLYPRNLFLFLNFPIFLKRRRYIYMYEIDKQGEKKSWALLNFCAFSRCSEDVERCQKWSNNTTQQIDLAFNIFFMVYFFIRVSGESSRGADWVRRVFN